MGAVPIFLFMKTVGRYRLIVDFQHRMHTGSIALSCFLSNLMAEQKLITTNINMRTS